MRNVKCNVQTGVLAVQGLSASVTTAVLKLCEPGKANGDVLSSSTDGKSFRKVLKRDWK